MKEKKKKIYKFNEKLSLQKVTFNLENLIKIDLLILINLLKYTPLNISLMNKN